MAVVHSDSGSEWSVTVDQEGDLGIDELVLSSEPVSQVEGFPMEQCEVEQCGVSGGGVVQFDDWLWQEGQDLPGLQQAEWVPELSPWEEAGRMFSLVPEPLQRWIEEVEFDGQAWHSVWERQRTVLPLLREFALQFPPEDRRGAVEWLFRSKGLLCGKDEDMFRHLLCKVPENFGFVQFTAGADVSAVKFVLSLVDCFFSMIDDRGFADCVVWQVEPKVVDPSDFKAGGVHTDSARRAWQELPGVSAHVQHWIQNKVWFKKKVHVIDRSARNTAEVDTASGKFDQEKFEFLDRKIQELLQCGAVVDSEMAKGCVPDVITIGSV